MVRGPCVGLEKHQGAQVEPALLCAAVSSHKWYHGPTCKNCYLRNYRNKTEGRKRPKMAKQDRRCSSRAQCRRCRRVGRGIGNRIFARKILDYSYVSYMIVYRESFLYSLCHPPPIAYTIPYLFMIA
jgi:hypothetical protein